MLHARMTHSLRATSKQKLVINIHNVSQLFIMIKAMALFLLLTLRNRHVDQNYYGCSKLFSTYPKIDFSHTTHIYRKGSLPNLKIDPCNSKAKDDCQLIQYCHSWLPHWKVLYLKLPDPSLSKGVLSHVTYVYIYCGFLGVQIK